MHVSRWFVAQGARKRRMPVEVQRRDRLAIIDASEKEPVMKSLAFLTGAVALAGVVAGCNPPIDQGQAFIEGVVPLERPACTASAGAAEFEASALLDIGVDAGHANNLILPLQVRTNLPSTFSSQNVTQDQTRSPNFINYGNTDEDIITFNQSEVFFSTDEDRGNQLQLGQVPGTPVNRGNERISTVSGVAFNQQTQLLTPSIVFATAIGKGDATLLQSEPFVNGAITASGLAHVILNLRLKGQTSGGATIETPVFPFPVDLCQGCLVGPTAVPENAQLDNTCGKDATGKEIQPIKNDDVCIEGNDFADTKCP